MTETWRQTMDLGIVHFMAYPVIKDDNPELTVSSVREIALDDFFDVIEVRRSDHDGVHEQIKAICDEAGLSIGIGAQPGLLLNKLSLNNSDAAGRRAAIDEVKKSVDAANEMGARICALLSGRDPGDDEGRKREMGLLVDSCVQLCKYAQDTAEGDPVWLSVEQFDYDIDKSCLIGPTARTVELAERVREEVPNFGVTIDLSHLPLLREDMTEWITQAAPYVIHLHAGNAVVVEGREAYGDYHPRFGYPGSENDMAELRAYLESLIFAGVFQNEVPTDKMVFTFEVKPTGSESTDLVLAHTKRTFLRAWAEV